MLSETDLDAHRSALFVFEGASMYFSTSTNQRIFCSIARCMKNPDSELWFDAVAERVVSTHFEYLKNLAVVDPARIVVISASFGGIQTILGAVSRRPAGGYRAPNPARDLRGVKRRLRKGGREARQGFTCPTHPVWRQHLRSVMMEVLRVVLGL